LGQPCVDEHLIDQEADEAAVESLGIALVEFLGHEVGNGFVAVAMDDEVEPFGVGRATDEAVRIVGGVEDGEVDLGIVSARVRNRQSAQSGRAGPCYRGRP